MDSTTIETGAAIRKMMRGVALAVAVMWASGCITVVRPAPGDDEPAADAVTADTGDEPAEDDGAYEPEADEGAPADEPAAKLETKADAPISDRVCTGELGASTVLTLEIQWARDHVSATCVVDVDGVEKFETYRMSTWNARAMRCDVDGWVFGTSDWIAFAVVPNTGGSQVKLDCGPEPF